MGQWKMSCVWHSTGERNKMDGKFVWRGCRSCTEGKLDQNNQKLFHSRLFLGDIWWWKNGILFVNLSRKWIILSLVRQLTINISCKERSFNISANTQKLAIKYSSAFGRASLSSQLTQFSQQHSVRIVKNYDNEHENRSDIMSCCVVIFLRSSTTTSCALLHSKRA